MFGDIGHGMMLLLFAAYLCFKEEQLSKMKLNEVPDRPFPLCFDLF